MELGKILKRIRIFGGDTAASLVLGYTEHFVLVCNQLNSNGYVDVPENWQNCKGISCDVAGIVRIGMASDIDGNITAEVVDLAKNIIRPVRNVQRIYYYATNLLTTPTVGTAKAYASDGTLYSNAIKLYR